MARSAVDRSELIRLATMHCAPSRNIVNSFLALSNEEQGREMRNARVATAFKHIFNCCGVSFGNIHVHPCADLWNRLYDEYCKSNLDNTVRKAMALASTMSYKDSFYVDIHMN